LLKVHRLQKMWREAYSSAHANPRLSRAILIKRSAAFWTWQRQSNGIELVQKGAKAACWKGRSMVGANVEEGRHLNPKSGAWG
jgi:hypothetical protein